MSSECGHVFAFYFEGLSTACSGWIRAENYFIQDRLLFYRMSKILRMRENGKFIIFDGQNNVLCLLRALRGRSEIELEVVELVKNLKVSPELHFFIGLLKKPAFEQVVYYAAQLGASTVQPLLTDRIHGNWFGEKEAERLRAVMVGAREQSKSFCEPELLFPCTISDVAFEAIKQSFVFDAAQAQAFGNMLCRMDVSEKGSSIGLFFGPEAGLSDEELRHITRLGANCCRLTPTTLRTQEAVLVAGGTILSVLS